jgi:hypothetical protein
MARPLCITHLVKFLVFAINFWCLKFHMFMFAMQIAHELPFFSLKCVINFVLFVNLMSTHLYLHGMYMIHNEFTISLAISKTFHLDPCISMKHPHPSHAHIIFTHRIKFKPKFYAQIPH